MSNTTPLQTRERCHIVPSELNVQNPVLGIDTGPYKVAKQCMCSGVYLSIRMRIL